MSKRGGIYDEEDVDDFAIKRARKENDGETSTALITSIKSQHTSLILRDTNINHRPSSLKAPEYILSGHEGAVYSLAFDPEGQFLASASMDRQICK
jgi:Prp8 binding protein